MTELQLHKSRKALLSFDSDVPGSMVRKKLEGYFGGGGKLVWRRTGELLGIADIAVWFSVSIRST